MLDFQLPVISGNSTISDAIAAAIDLKTAGLLYEAGPGELRLVHYYGLVQAAKDESSTPLSEVVFEPVVDIETVPDTQVHSYLTNQQRRFGFIRTSGAAMVRILSVSEAFGFPFASVAPGRRCTRPNKRPHVPDRKWYHYPPHNIDPNDPDKCVVCGSPLL